MWNDDVCDRYKKLTNLRQIYPKTTTPELFFPFGVCTIHGSIYNVKLLYVSREIVNSRVGLFTRKLARPPPTLEFFLSMPLEVPEGSFPVAATKAFLLPTTICWLALNHQIHFAYGYSCCTSHWSSSHAILEVWSTSLLVQCPHS